MTPEAARAWNVDGSKGAENTLPQSDPASEEEGPSWEDESP